MLLNILHAQDSPLQPRITQPKYPAPVVQECTGPILRTPFRLRCVGKADYFTPDCILSLPLPSLPPSLSLSFFLFLFLSCFPSYLLSFLPFLFSVLGIISPTQSSVSPCYQPLLSSFLISPPWECLPLPL